ncbi:MAG: hypothetical protein ACM3P0_06920 [Acidobacteriota bacterium]
MSDEQIFERIKDALRGKVETFLEKVTPVYAALNWEWNVNGEKRVPNEEDVMFKLYNLIDALQFNKRGYWTASCGLKVQYQFKKEGIEVSMVFTKEIADKGIYNF